MFLCFVQHRQLPVCIAAAFGIMCVKGQLANAQRSEMAFGSACSMLHSSYAIASTACAPFRNCYVRSSGILRCSLFY